MVNQNFESNEQDFGSIVREIAVEAHKLLGEQGPSSDEYKAKLGTLSRRIARLERSLDGSTSTELKTWLEMLGRTVHASLEGVRTGTTPRSSRRASAATRP